MVTKPPDYAQRRRGILSARHLRYVTFKMSLHPRHIYLTQSTDVYMPLIYGEGRENALKRLLKEIYKPLQGKQNLVGIQYDI
jgi:hypothetical protein